MQKQKLRRDTVYVSSLQIRVGRKEHLWILIIKYAHEL